MIFKSNHDIHIYYFSEAEFRGQLYLVNPKLVICLDLFRASWGAPVDISPHPGAIGRVSGTWHDYEKHGSIHAVDVMPRGMNSEKEARRALKAAINSGFTGIGIYPHWRPAPGLHVDVRTDRVYMKPALWGGIRQINDETGTRTGKQVYVSTDEAFKEFDA